MNPKRPSDYPWPVTAHHASFIEDFNNAMDSRPITPTTASDSAMSTPTATPRTDDGLLAVALACEYVKESVTLAGTDMKEHGADIRRVLAELSRLRADLERFTGHGLLDCHAICDQRDAAIARAERAEAALAAEREKVRVLREALENYQNCVIAGGTNPARTALEGVTEMLKRSDARVTAAASEIPARSE